MLQRNVTCRIATVSDSSCAARAGSEQAWSMKRYIREILKDLQSKKPDPAVPQDLDNQELSKDPEQKVRQLDYQAQKSEERQTLQ